jgi:hypothetical protein
MSVELVKDEIIGDDSPSGDIVGEDLTTTRTVDVTITNGIGPTTVAVSLTQVSTDKNKCVSHLVPEVGDTLHEFTVGNQYYSKLEWTEPLMAGNEVRTVSRLHHPLQRAGLLPQHRAVRGRYRPAGRDRARPAEQHR